ncbi:laminin subunit gamma-3 [Aplochiton taeniatus]
MEEDNTLHKPIQYLPCRRLLRPIPHFTHASGEAWEKHKEWVTATDLLISLDRLNTFGDEFFKDTKVLRSYFYAISDFSVGGRCKCNGHSSDCVEEQSGLVCSCQHHTAGEDCQKCHPFYQDRPWARATAESANECMKCNCSGRSDVCVFDAEQYRGTGSGGRCVDCRDNTDGPHCGRCREHHFRISPNQLCNPCLCNQIGSVSLQCDAEGKCVCRAGVTGEKCDTCQPGFHSLGAGGCRLCACDPRGSVGLCSPQDGSCRCRASVEGQLCNRCKPGFFDLQQENPAGCQTCFCFGHSVACSSSNNHAAIDITSDFTEDPDGWSGEFSEGQDYPLIWKEGEVYLLPLTEEDVGFYKASGRFLGNQLLSYNQVLSITFTAETVELLPGHITVVLEGSGRTLTADLSLQPHNTHITPGISAQRTFIIRLQEGERRLKPSISAFEFRHLLFNLTALRISNAGGLNYTSQLSEVTMASATLSPHPDAQAHFVEVCVCPPGFTGQFCELCASGFTREVPEHGPLSHCVPCDCHQHGHCHPETGVCECADFTTGRNCDRCQDGYYGNALFGTTKDCQPCPCPDHSSCAQMANTREVVCTNCPAGQRGTRCEMCDDGFYGDPLGKTGTIQPCRRCDCNGNVDPNAVGVCDHKTGRCLKCLSHTEGVHCQNCQKGYYGNALDQTTNQKCKSCSCNSAGTFGSLDVCHLQTGSCLCLSHVTGRDCGHCEVGFFNLQHGIGCEMCNCNPIGSLSMACNPITGQCLCRAGVEGRSCDSCHPGFFGFSSQGCRACNCDPMGSVSMQCNRSGSCECRMGFMGHHCEKCEVNYFHNRVTHQCEECPVCYGLVKDQAEKLSVRLQDLDKLLARFNCRDRYGKRYHIIERHHYEHQGEDTLPNALEDFLAVQEARDAFIKQFSLLGISTHTLSAQLHGAATALNCSISKEEEEEGEKKNDEDKNSVCGTLAVSVSVVGAAQTHLKQATLDLNNMNIPLQVPLKPNQWSTSVNNSLILMEKHSKLAEHIEDIAKNALTATNQTYSLLMDLLEDNSTENYIVDLVEKLADMQQRKENMTAQWNESLVNQLVFREASEFKVVAGNLTSSIRELAQMDPSSNRTVNYTDVRITPSANITDSIALLNRTAELDIHVQTKENLVSKIQEEIEPIVQTDKKNMEVVQNIYQLNSHAQGSKVLALSSVVKGKEVESDVITLFKELEDNQREWPTREAKTKVAVKKEKLLEKKVLAEVRKRVMQVEKIVKPSMENATLSNTTATEAELKAHMIVKESTASLTQAKHTRTTSAQISSSINTALQKIDELENQTAKTELHVASEDEVSMTSLKGKMEAAKLQLEAYSLSLTQLLSSIDGSLELEHFERTLNETALRLSLLRRSVENPALNEKIQKLRSVAKEQQGYMLVMEKDLQEIREERDSLKDITLHLPLSCPQASEKGRH